MNFATLRGRGQMAFTMVEALVAVGITAISALSLYAGFSMGFSVIQSTRDNLRATQILVRRTEAIRLYTWSQLQNTNYLKPSFVEFYDPMGGTNGFGTTYYGTVATVIPNDLPAAYRTNMRNVSLTLWWTNYVGGRPKAMSQTMETRVARHGMQNYVYGK